MNRSGSGGTIIFVIIAVAVGIFFACRELMCWYYKINRIVSLLEDQIRLLKMQITFVPTHMIKLMAGENELKLLKKPYVSDASAAEVIENLPNGTKVQFLEKNSTEVELNGIKGTWFRIMTQEKTDGWVFSGNLEKI
jgi:hypothetical protein